MAKQTKAQILEAKIHHIGLLSQMSDPIGDRAEEIRRYWDAHPDTTEIPSEIYKYKVIFTPVLMEIEPKDDDEEDYYEDYCENPNIRKVDGYILYYVTQWLETEIGKKGEDWNFDESVELSMEQYPLKYIVYTNKNPSKIFNDYTYITDFDDKQALTILHYEQDNPSCWLELWVDENVKIQSGKFEVKIL